MEGVAPERDNQRSTCRLYSSGAWRVCRYRMAAAVSPKVRSRSLTVYHAARRNRKFGLPLYSVLCRGRHGHPDKSPFVTGDNERIAALLVSRQVAWRNLIVGWIE